MCFISATSVHRRIKSKFKDLRVGLRNGTSVIHHTFISQTLIRVSCILGSRRRTNVKQTMSQIKSAKLLTIHTNTTGALRSEWIDHCEEEMKRRIQWGFAGWVGVCHTGKGHATLNAHLVQKYGHENQHVHQKTQARHGARCVRDWEPGRGAGLTGERQRRPNCNSSWDSSWYCEKQSFGLW